MTVRARVLVVVEARRLEVEHRAVAAAERHQLVVGAELDDPAVLDHADAVGAAHGREPVRDEDRRAAPRGVEQPVEDLGLAADVELGRGLVEDARRRRRAAPRRGRAPARRAATGRPRGRCRPRSPRQHRVERRRGRSARAPARGRRARSSSDAPAGRDVVAQRQLVADEVLEDGRDPRRATTPTSSSRRSTPSTRIAPVVGVVEAAEQLGERRLAGAVLADDGERPAGGDREVEAVEDRAVGRAGRRSATSSNRISRAGSPSAGRVAASGSAPAGRHGVGEVEHQRHRLRRRAEPPVELAEGERAGADGRLREDDERAERRRRPRSRRGRATRRTRRWRRRSARSPTSVGRQRSRRSAHELSSSWRRSDAKPPTTQSARPKSRSSLAAGASTASR